MAHAFSALVLSLAAIALLGARTARADGGSDAAWDEERRAALKAALHEAEQRGEEKRVAEIRRELEAMGKAATAPKQPATSQQLKLRILELRSDSAMARTKGNVEDAEAGARKARVLEEALAARRDSEEFERRARELKANGHAEDAEVAMRRAAETMKYSLELEAQADGRRRPKGHDTAKSRVDHLRAAAKHLREAGMADLAERIENAAREAEAQEREKEKAAQQARPADGEIDALRAQVAELQKRLEDLKARLEQR